MNSFLSNTFLSNTSSFFITSSGNNTEIDLKYVVERIADLTEVQYQQKVTHLKAVRKYFTYAGKLSSVNMCCYDCSLL